MTTKQDRLEGKLQKKKNPRCNSENDLTHLFFSFIVPQNRPLSLHPPPKNKALVIKCSRRLPPTTPLIPQKGKQKQEQTRQQIDIFIYNIYSLFKNRTSV